MTSLLDLDRPLTQRWRGRGVFEKAHSERYLRQNFPMMYTVYSKVDPRFQSKYEKSEIETIPGVPIFRN